MSSSPASSLSFLPAMVSNSISLDKENEEKILTASGLVKGGTHSEHHTMRLVFILFNILFPTKEWNFVPQFYTHMGKWPDLVLERFYYRPDNKRKSVFVSKIFLECKTEKSSDDPIQQLKEAIPLEYGVWHSSRGVLIGVKGLHWRFVDYQFVGLPGQTHPELFFKDFYDTSNDPGNLGRPKPSKVYKEGDYMDLQSEAEAKDIISALLWLVKGKPGRDLTFMDNRAKPIPKSITCSTLGMNWDKDDDVPIFLDTGFKEEFSHLIPILQENDVLGSMARSNLSQEMMDMD